MLRIFKQNDIGAVFVLVVFTFILKARYLLHPPELPELGMFHKALFFSLDGLPAYYSAHPTMYVFWSVCLILLFAFYLNYVVNRERFYQRKSYLPALSFVLFSSFSPVLNVFSVPFLANLLLFMAFSRTMMLYNSSRARRESFDIGMLVALAGMFYFPSLLLFFLFLMLLWLLRPFSLEESLAYVLGVCTPFYLGFAAIFLLGHWNDWDNMGAFHLTPPLRTLPVWPLLILTVVSISMLVYGLYMVNQAAPKNTMAVRKKWNGVVLYVFFTCVAGVLAPVFPGVPWIIAITPISILLGQTFLNNTEKYNTFTFYFLLAIVAIVQWLL